jgi:hypothetical protein
MNIKLHKEHFVGEPSFTVFEENGVYYALNNFTKELISGTDASTVIQQAINALTNGGILFIKAGRYFIKSPIILADNIRIVGESYPNYLHYPSTKLTLATTLVLDADVNMFVASFNSSTPLFSSLEDLNLEGAGYAKTAVFLSKAQVVTLKNVAFHDFDEYGISINGGEIISVDHCAFYDINKEGVSLSDWYGEIHITHSIFNTCNPAIFASGYGNRVVIEYNDIYSSPTHGIALNGLSDNLNNLLIQNNNIHDNSYYGIAFSNYVISPIVIANRFSNNGWGALNMRPPNAFIRYNWGYVTENSGTATFSGNGTQTQFTIPHGLAGTPKVANVTPASNDAKGNFYVTADSTNVYVNYATAPPAGTNNVVLYWSASM